MAETWVLDDSERTPPGGSAEAGAAATGVLDDGECASPSTAISVLNDGGEPYASAAHRTAAQPGVAICQVDKRDGVELKDM